GVARASPRDEGTVSCDIGLIDGRARESAKSRMRAESYLPAKPIEAPRCGRRAEGCLASRPPATIPRKSEHSLIHKASRTGRVSTQGCRGTAPLEENLRSWARSIAARAGSTGKSRAEWTRTAP